MDVYINYEWEHKKASLDFEIMQLQRQLESINKREELLKFELPFYFACIIVPFLLVCITKWTSYFSYLFLILYSIFQVAYIVSLPFTLYALIKAVFLRILTEKTDADTWEKPPLRSPGTPTKPAREPSYIIERKKVLWVLSKYYTYRDRLEQMHKQMEEGTFSMTLEETQAVFEEMPYYVEITPADSFTGEPLRKAKRLTVLLFLLLGAYIVIEIWKTLGSLFHV